MLKIIVSGCNGRMGQTVVRLAGDSGDIEVIAGFDINSVRLSGFPVYASPSECGENCDVVVDFSNPSNLDNLLTWCVSTGTPAVLCTTGYSEDQLKMIERVSKMVPIFRSGNMSLGVNLVRELVKRTAAVLGENYDIEIVERHHNKKLDAPSGTAILLADAASEALPGGMDYVYERESVRKARGKRDIGISSVRGGTIVGDHEVIFAGIDEVIEIKHSAFSRDVFANGAISAVRYLSKVGKPGLYSMDDLIKNI
ncbi:MAG: 4-hydroxy-tetrahydrodipicolinate reductase [Oscillospiraceae bacterium]